MCITNICAVSMTIRHQGVEGSEKQNTTEGGKNEVKPSSSLLCSLLHIK